MGRKRSSNLTAGLALALLAMSTSALAQDGQVPAAGRTDHALFDGTDAENPESGVTCGVRNGGGNKPVAFTIYVAVSNWCAGTAVLRLTYADPEFARFQIPGNSSFSFAQAAGGTKGVDDLLTIADEALLDGEGPGCLAGAVSISTSAAGKKHPELESFCVTNEAS